MKTRPTPGQISVLLLVAAAAVAIHGYHPFVEDGEIYVPGIKQLLNPALYPHNAEFFTSHARLTLFPNLIAASVRLTHLPLDWALLLWHIGSVFLLLLACWHIGRQVFVDSLAPWGGVALVGSLLTIPVAGTALYIMDQYLTPRSLSAPGVLFLLVNVMERKFWRAGLWTVFTAAIHPLMVVFGVTCAGLMIVTERRYRWLGFPRAAACLLPLSLFPPVTDAYREILESRPYFFVVRWAWYEWLGALGPLVLLWWFGRIARRRKLVPLENLCRAVLWFGIFFLACALVLSIPGRLASLAELQPMRSLHPLYILLFVCGGGLLAQFLLQKHLVRWLLLLLPVCLGMYSAQRALFPSTPHIEWPWAGPQNDWLKAFLWIRDNTPIDAYFALNPQHMRLKGEDQHGFRAIAERSMLADAVKDSGAASMFPALAETWRRQVR
ncbi:MAG TPA: hypothetical protein VH744_02870, partial [Terriglobales bacterium]